MRRALGLLLATTLAAGGLALGTVPSASAVTDTPTLDGPVHVFVTGTSLDVSGTDTSAIGGTVDLALDGVSVGTADVQPDGTWQATLDLTGLVDDRHFFRATTTMASLHKYIYVHHDLTSLQITSPAAGATITSTTDGCIPVTATLDAPGATLDSNVRDSHLDTATTMTRVSPTVTGTTVTTCLPVNTTPNGAAELFIWLSATDRGYLARIPVTLNLTTGVTATSYVGTSGLGVRGVVTDLGPDTVITASLDGGPATAVEVRQANRNVTTPWTFTHWAETWDLTDAGQPYLDRALADGSHSVTFTVTSRGVTSQVGPYTGVISGAGKIEIDTVEQLIPGVYRIEGTVDNALARIWPQYGLYAESFRGTTLIEKNTSPRYVWSADSVYGQDRFSIAVSTGTEPGPAKIRVSALSNNLDVACDAVTVEGLTVTPAACGPVPPGVPTGVTITSTSPTTAKLTFTPPASTGGAPILGYRAQTLSAYASPDPAFTSTGSTPSISLSGLATAGDVSVDVTARTSAGTSYASRPVRLYASDIFCNVKPKSTLAVNAWVSVTCAYDNGVRGVDVMGPVKVSLQARKPGSTVWTTLSSKVVPYIDNVTFAAPLKTVTGKWSLRMVAPAVAVPAGLAPGVVRPAISPTMTTSVTGPAPKLTLSLSNNRITLGKSVVFTGKSTPTYAGQKVFLMRYSQGGWWTMASRVVSSTGVYSFTFKPTSRYDLKYQVWTAAANGRPAGSSPSLLLTVL